MVVELIAKDKKEKLQFEGKCKLKIDAVSKLLLVEPEIEVFDCLVKKGVLVIAGDKTLIQQRFLLPFFNEIVKNDEPSYKFKEILVNWLQKQEIQEKEDIIQLLKAKNIYGLCYPNEEIENNKRRNLRKRRAKNISYKENKNGNMESDNHESGSSDYSNSVGSNGVHNYHIFNKTPAKKQKLTSKSVPSVIEAPFFEVRKYFHENILIKKLVILPSLEKKYCYEYYWKNSQNFFICYLCLKKGKTSTAKIIQRNGRDVVQLNGTQHICEFREYRKIIEKQNFEVIPCELFKKNGERLVVFLDSSRINCYEYSYNKNWKIYACCGCLRKKYRYSAKICQKEDGTKFVILNSSKHVCEPRNFNPEKYVEKEIVEADNFKIYENFLNGINRSKLVIFASAEKTTCYKYYWNNRNKIFYCCGCHIKNKTATAELCQNSDGREYLKLSRKKHVCEPREYDPKKYAKKETVETDNFKIFKNIQNGIDRSKLAIFTSYEKSTCYEYYWNNGEKVFLCCGCDKRKKRNRAEVCQNSDGSQYLKLIKAEKHVCDPREYDPGKFEMSNEVIESPNFKIFKYKHKREIKSSLVIFCPSNKMLCYEYFWSKNRKNFQCCCCRFGKNVVATVCHNVDRNDYVQLSKSHDACQLREFDADKFKDDIIVKKPMYEIMSKTSKNAPSIVIFTTESKDMCYKFNYNIREKYYQCSKCYYLNLRIYIFAVIENEGKENEFIAVSNQKHVCEPVKFSHVVQDCNRQIVTAPNFQLIKRKVFGKIVQHLVIFTNDEKSECYEYTWGERHKYFICTTCSFRPHNIHVYAKLIKKDDNEECVELSAKPHKCTPVKFIPEDITSKTVKEPNFKLYETVFQRKKKQRLVIYDPKDKKLGYVYSYLAGRMLYVCMKCQEKKKYITAKVLQDKNGHSSVELCKYQHVCEIQKL
uniref:Uncharacterized protein n=1 Tax=Panagrolaimus sp. ES5 TaxID=591445 RepID=A0AC34GSB2_9BILA